MFVIVVHVFAAAASTQPTSFVLVKPGRRSASFRDQRPSKMHRYCTRRRSRARNGSAESTDERKRAARGGRGGGNSPTASSMVYSLLLLLFACPLV